MPARGTPNTARKNNPANRQARAFLMPNQRNSTAARRTPDRPGRGRAFSKDASTGRKVAMYYRRSAVPGCTSAPRPASSPGASADSSFHELADPCLVGDGQLLQRKGRRPHVAIVEVRLVAEAERCIPRLELPCVLKEAENLAVLRVGRHPVPEPRRQLGGAGPDDGMEPFAHGAIGRAHRGDLREHGSL